MIWFFDKTLFKTVYIFTTHPGISSPIIPSTSNDFALLYVVVMAAQCTSKVAGVYK